MEINEQAIELNEIIKKTGTYVYDLLSEHGKAAFFPKKGILGQTAEAKGTKINATLGQAFEDDTRPMALDVLKDQFKLPPAQSLLYSPSYGQKELREIWKKHILEKNPSIKTNISLPVVTNAITHGLLTANKLFVDKGDIIITPDLFWENYKLTFDDAELDQFKTFEKNGFNIEGLKEKLKENGEKKIVLLNFPNNPTGYSPTEKEAEQIAAAIMQAAESGKNIVVICDDAYFGFVYENGLFKESIFAKLCNLHERVLAVKIDGVSKEAFAWGLRIGFITYGFKGMTNEAAQALEDKTAGAVRGTISNACTNSQFAVLNALKSTEFQEQFNEKYEILKERYNTMRKTLEKNKKYQEFFTPLPFSSGYFMAVELKQHDANTIRKKLIEKYSTGAIAMGNLLRIAYSSVGKEKIPELFENVYKACKKEHMI